MTVFGFFFEVATKDYKFIESPPLFPRHNLIMHAASFMHVIKLSRREITQ